MIETLRAGIYQYRCRDEEPTARLDRLDKTLADSGEKTDLVVCPELFLSGYNVGERVRELAEPKGGPFQEKAAAIARKHRTAVVYGYPERDDGVVYNAAICLDANGSMIAHHRKLRLPNQFEKTNFACGSGYTQFAINGWKVAILICYDVEFPEAMRACALSGAHFVVAPTALKKEWAFVARTVIPTRAFENGLFLAYANYCGIEGDFEYLGGSCFAGPGGKVVSADDDEVLLTSNLHRSELESARRVLPYLDDCRSLAWREA